MKREKGMAAAAAVCCALMALMVGSSASPLYCTHFWTDSNIYMTIGRGMARGLMPYRDLFDHKGPLQFMLYAAAAWMEDASFIGLFVLEVLALAAMLYAGWRMVRAYADGTAALCVIPLTAMLTVGSRAFTLGGSGEEFCLPALCAGLAAAVLRMRGGETGARPLRLYALIGACTGWVFAIKYTDCGLFIGMAPVLAGYELYTGGLRKAGKALLAVLAGFAAVLLPIALCFAAGGAMDDLVQGYFVQNLTYAGGGMTPMGHVINALAYLYSQSRANPAVAGAAVLGMAAHMAAALKSGRKGRAFEAALIPVSAGMLLLTCYWGEVAHPYYALVFAAFVPLGWLPAARLGRKMTAAGAGLTAACMLAVIPVCLQLCVAVPLMRVRWEETAQYRFAERMRAEQGDAPYTLLDVTGHDQGFYMAAGLVPDCRYFCDNNLDTAEKREAIAGYLDEGRTTYVVTRGRDPGERYEQIDEAQSLFDDGQLRQYRLYRRVGEEETE